MPGVDVCAPRVGVKSTKIKVGDGEGVMLGVQVGSGVHVGVRVGGSSAAVCVEAACAVCTTIVLIAPGGSGVMAGAGAIRVDTSQLMSTSVSASSPLRILRRGGFVADSPEKDCSSRVYGSWGLPTSILMAGQQRPPSTLYCIP